MKKFLVIALSLMLVLALAACGNANEKAIIGTWQLADGEEAADYGLGIEFTKDGKLRYGLTEEVLKALADGEDTDDAMAGLDALLSFTYEIKSDTEMEITAKALFGLASESDTVTYSLDGDTLEFDGVKYVRAK